MKALCCVCGALRECRRARNHQAENYWLQGWIDPKWWRETGDLKCAECGKITRHALLHPEGDSFRDHAERVTRIALGTTIDDHTQARGDNRRQIQAAYRQGRQANPFLNHRWSQDDTEAARKAGRDYVIVFCGERIALPPPDGISSVPADEPAVPDEVRWDQEYEDETGRWWLEMDCVDCYRVANERRMQQRRDRLAELFRWGVEQFAAQRISDTDVETLIAAFEGIGADKNTASDRGPAR